MRCVAYISSAVKPFSEAELKALLEKSRENNSKKNITGMLLYKDAKFMQVLEGSGLDLLELLNIIRKDSRHRNLITLLDEETKNREFSGWSMGFRNLNDPSITHVPGYERFVPIPLTSDVFKNNTSEAHKLLGLFKHLEF